MQLHQTINRAIDDPEYAEQLRQKIHVAFQQRGNAFPDLLVEEFGITQAQLAKMRVADSDKADGRLKGFTTTTTFTTGTSAECLTTTTTTTTSDWDGCTVHNGCI